MKTIGCMLAMAVSLSACASTQMSSDQSPGFQNAVYVVGDASAPVKAMPQDESLKPNDDKSDDSAIKRLYWFFAGR